MRAFCSCKAGPLEENSFFEHGSKPGVLLPRLLMASYADTVSFRFATKFSLIKIREAGFLIVAKAFFSD